MTSPLTTPCAHNFCKPCLEGAFAGQSFTRERTCEGRRALRVQKNIMKCPSCSTDIAEYLQNPQVWQDEKVCRDSLSNKTLGSFVLKFSRKNITQLLNDTKIATI